MTPSGTTPMMTPSGTTPTITPKKTNKALVWVGIVGGIVIAVTIVTIILIRKRK